MSNDLPGSLPEKSPTEHARDRDPVTGEPIHSKEPDSELPAPIEGAPAPAAAEEVAPEPEAKKPELFKDDARRAIFAKRDGMTTDERTAFVKAQPEEAALSEQVAGGELVEEEETPAAPAPASAPAAPASAPLAQGGKKYKLTIYGKDAGEVSEEEVLRAGIATLQKQHAVDERMQQVSTREGQVLAYADSLQALADNLSKGLDMDGRPLQPAGGPANPAPTPTGGAGAIDRAKVAKASSLLLRGDDEAGAAMLAEAVEEAIAKGREPTPAPAAPRKVEVPKLPAAPAPSDPWGTSQREAANTVFNDEYGDLSDAQFTLAQQSLNGLMAVPANKSRSLEDLVRQAGNLIRRASGAPAPVQPAAPAQPAPVNPLESRRTLKARLPVTTPPASGRAPSGQQPAPKVPNNAEYVRSLQVRSGSNSSPRR